MILITFTLYLILFLILTLALGLNSVRIARQTSSNPKIFTLLLPLLINFLLAHSIFYQVNPLFTTLLPCLLSYFGFKKLQKVRIFGITGGVCSGKNTLLELINKHLRHLEFVDTYDVFRKLIEKGQPCYNKILKELGSSSNQFLNKKNEQIILAKLYDQIAKNKKIKMLIQQQMKFGIFWRVFRQIIKNIINKKIVLVVNFPSQFECNSLKYLCYPIIFVSCPYSTQVERVCQKYKCNQVEASKRLENGVSNQHFKRNSQIQIQNTGTEEMLLSDFLTKVKPYMNINQYKGDKKSK